MVTEKSQFLYPMRVMPDITRFGCFCSDANRDPAITRQPFERKGTASHGFANIDTGQSRICVSG
jgi:hypothetical protein